MIDSNNIEIMRDNLKELDQKIENLDVEIPEHTSGDSGKYLGVDSSGDLEFSDPLPATSGASTGDVLGLVGENKSKGWITPFTPIDYSTTEQDTGIKWIDGKNIYCKVLTLPEDSVTQSPIENTINLGTIDTLLYFIGTIKSTRTALGDYVEFDLTDYYSGDHNTRTDYNSGPSQFNLRLICPSTYHFGGAKIIAYYTKPTTETITKKKKSTK